MGAILSHYHAFLSYFEQAAMFCENHSTLIPLTFVLAFYVSHVVSRWWAQWNAMPWPDGLAFKINSYCSGLVRSYLRTVKTDNRAISLFFICHLWALFRTRTRGS